MTATVTIRPFESSDQPAVLTLLRESLGETTLLQRRPDLFAWKHLENPFGRSIMLVAEDSAGIAGFRAFMRWELVDSLGERLRCVRAVDTATHPRIRRQGVFRRLTLEAVDAARADNVDLIFNTPNPRSGAGYRAMGWTEVGKIGVQVRPRLRGWGRRATTPSLTAGRPWEDAVLSDRRARGLRTPRTPEYLRWRFASHPTAGYRAVGDSEGMAVVRPNLRRGRGELVISELFGPEAEPALRSAIRSSDAAYAVGWFARSTPERTVAIRAGLLPVPGVSSLHLHVRPLNELGLDVVGLEQWDLSMADLELL